MVKRRRFTRGALNKQGRHTGSSTPWNVIATRGSSKIGSNKSGNFSQIVPSMTRRDSGNGSRITADGASKRGSNFRDSIGKEVMETQLKSA